jgi:hypothetical protein
MAEQPSITVSIEASLHAALRNVLQSLANEHGVRVTDVTVEWQVNRMVSVEQPQARITQIQIVSESL